MELYMSKIATVVNPFRTVQEPSIKKKGEYGDFMLFPNLPTELRLKIWAFCYLVPQAPRIVEVRTQNHNNCPAHKGFCPRYSRGPKHPLINTNHEARSVTRFSAHKAGHLIFSSHSHSTLSPSTEIIIFNPAYDLLFLPNESPPLPRTRGPQGTYTQYKKSHSPPSDPLSNPSYNEDINLLNWNCNNNDTGPHASHLRFLALSLERHGTQFNPIRLALHDFPHLEDLLLIAPSWPLATEISVSGLEENLKTIMGAWERQISGRFPTLELGSEEREGSGVLAERKWPRVRIAVRCERGRLEFCGGGEGNCAALFLNVVRTVSKGRSYGT